MVLKRSSMLFPGFLGAETSEVAARLKGESGRLQADNQCSSSVRAMAAFGGGWNGASGAPASAAEISVRLNQRASSSSVVSIFSSLSFAVAAHPIISDD